MKTMMDTPEIESLSRFLDVNVSRNSLITSNLANIDTPGYQALGMDFESEMRTALDDVDQERAPLPVHVTAVDGLVSRPDGNNVSMDRESLNLAEAQLKFKTGVALLHQEYQREMDAIHADSK